MSHFCANSLCLFDSAIGGLGLRCPRSARGRVIPYRPSSLYHDTRGYKRRGPARYRINAGVGHAACCIGCLPAVLFLFLAVRGICLFSTGSPRGPKGCSMGAERVIKGCSAQDHPNLIPIYSRKTIPLRLRALTCTRLLRLDFLAPL